MIRKRTFLAYVVILTVILVLMIGWVTQYGKVHCYQIYEDHSVTGTYCQTGK